MNFASLQQKKELYNQKKGSIDSITKIRLSSHGFNRGMKAKKFIFLYLCVYFS